jgi:hypothetical protein
MSGDRNTNGKAPARRGARMGFGPRRPDGVRVDRVPVRVSLDDYAEALTLAESGELLLAERVIARRGRGRKRIIVLGCGRRFSARLSGYALQLAARLRYGLVFLSVGPGARSPGEASPAMDGYLRESFASAASEAARPHLLKALELGVEAGHMVHFGEPEEAVRAVSDGLHRVELILSDPGNAEGVGLTAPAAVFTVS